MFVIGFDPGTPPTIAALDTRYNHLTFYEETDVGIMHNGKTRTGNSKNSWTTSYELVASVMQQLTGADMVAIENVNLLPLQNIASGMPFVGTKYLAIGLCLGLGVPYQLVGVQWRSKYGLPGKKNDPQNSLLRQLAIRTFPKQASMFSRVKDHNRADAAMIAHHAASMLKQK